MGSTLVAAGLLGVRLGVIVLALRLAYGARLYAVHTYGKVIHEFDPWFNFRATEYLAEHGAEKFFRWYDHSVWYPIGRPVGTTIYPGMQFIAVWIWNGLNAYNIDMSLNDVCVLLPAWFGVVATALVGLLTWEGTGCANAGAASAFIMSIIPAHIMRSVAGGFDNESVAISALCSTFYCWVRSLRGQGSWPWGIITGLSYFWMVASWGGYVYVLNMIGLHCTYLLITGRYSAKLHLAYTLFYIVGTGLAIQIPVVGTTPLRSLEQMGPMGIFFALQIWGFCEVVRKRTRMTDERFARFRYQILATSVGCAAVVAAVLFQAGYFGPISARVRGLFVKHTRTGNPLVDSVAEHQATSPRAYWQYLHYMCYLAPIGFGMSVTGMTDAKSFLLLYAGVTYYFSSKMNRLVLLLGPIASVLGGTAAANLLKWSVLQLYDFHDENPQTALLMPRKGVDLVEPKPVGGDVDGHKRTKHSKAGSKGAKQKPQKDDGNEVDELWECVQEMYTEAYSVRKAASVLLLLGGLYNTSGFVGYCFYMAEAMSSPSIMFRTKLENGTIVIVDDYREAYWWLRDNTPEDSRIMAWWDYGYQISGLAKRTTIADGNTWNHEHIALLGRCLTGPERQSHDVVRHLADYVLLWAGGGGDDLAKSPHMARIANSVYSDLCPGDPTCRQFGIRKGEPTPMMAESLLYRLHSHGTEDVEADPTLFKEVYKSKYGFVRIFEVLNVSQASKSWATDPANYVCDAPGSWFCRGQYPPALNSVLEKQHAFKQLEDFNRHKDRRDEEYQKAYHAKMAEGARGSR